MAWRRVSLLLIVVSLAVLLAHYGAEVLVVDSCLDSGGAYDYAAARCRTDVPTLPYVPYRTRHGALLAAIVAVGLAGATLLVQARR